MRMHGAAASLLLRDVVVIKPTYGEVCAATASR